MSPPDPVRSAAMRSSILSFLQQRFEAKAEKLNGDSTKLAELRAQFIPEVWLADAARRVSQIQAVTHSLKPIHPDAKGSSLYCEPTKLAKRPELGSHVLGAAFDADVVGNAAALDVYKFLKVTHEGQSILSLCTTCDPDLSAALHTDPTVASAWIKAFADLAQAREKFRSHTHAKQIYWPLAEPQDNSAFHLLAPLYPTSLVHRVYQSLQADRFSDDAKAARAARKTEEWHDRPVREYHQLAVQKLGGTKPQNISQLNSERRGDNFLLASLPPVWRSAAVKPLLGMASMFDAFHWRAEVRAQTQQLRRFFEGGPARNLATRARRDDMVESLLDELMQFIAAVQTLPPGWSADVQCMLPAHQIALLDDSAGGPQADETMSQLAADFAHWLNAHLREPLPMGDAEFLHWRRQARELFEQSQREGNHEQ